MTVATIPSPGSPSAEGEEQVTAPAEVASGPAPRPTTPGGTGASGSPASWVRIALAATMASLAGAGDVKLAVVPFGVVAALGLAYLALTRFELFVLTCLFIRSSLDAVGGQGTTITNPSSLISLAFMAARAAVAGRPGLSRRPHQLDPDAAADVLHRRLPPQRVHLAAEGPERGRVLPHPLRRRDGHRPRAPRGRPARGQADHVRRDGLGAHPAAGLARHVRDRCAADGQAGRAGRTASSGSGARSTRPTASPATCSSSSSWASRSTPTCRSGGGSRCSPASAGLGVLMILTYTRSSWLALVVGLLVVGWLQSKSCCWCSSPWASAWRCSCRASSTASRT